MQNTRTSWTLLFDKIGTYLFSILHDIFIVLIVKCGKDHALIFNYYFRYGYNSRYATLESLVVLNMMFKSLKLLV